MSLRQKRQIAARSAKKIPQRFVPRTSIRAKVLRQSILLVVFCVLLLGGLSFSIVMSLRSTLERDALTGLRDVHTLGVTVLVESGLLILLALFLSTLLARGVSHPLRELTAKVQGLRPGAWVFRQTVRTGDEVEALDRVFADLTARLRDAYEHLEEKVVGRTRQLREEYALDRAILESIEYGILAMDKEGRITEANPGVCRLLRRSRETLIGISAVDALHVLQHAPPHARNSEHPVRCVLKKRTAYHSHPSFHLRLQLPDQTALPVALVIVPLFRSASFFGALAVIQDMSVERQIDYLKSEFISLASHQLRTPLSSIRWYAEMLLHEKHTLPRQSQSHVVQIDVAARRMANLIEALLRVAKLEEGGLTPVRTRVNLRAFLRRMGEEWITIAEEQQVQLSLHLPQSLLNISTDLTLLAVILQNLLTNALRYSVQKRPISLSVRMRRNSVEIIIRDEGVGIPQSEQKRVFQKFFRAWNVRQFATEGSGLGLYMSKSIAESLGGTITFESEEGKGSAFTVSLPL